MIVHPHDRVAANPSQQPVVTHFVPPTARELRAQSVQRLQVGLFGLAGMLLMVGLANIIMDRVRQADAAKPATTAAEASAAPKSDPLADIGIVPSATPSASPAPPAVDPVAAGTNAN